MPADLGNLLSLGVSLAHGDGVEYESLVATLLGRRLSVSPGLRLEQGFAGSPLPSGDRRASESPFSAHMPIPAGYSGGDFAGRSAASRRMPMNIQLRDLSRHTPFHTAHLI